MIMTRTNGRNIKSRFNQRLGGRACGVVVAAMTLTLAVTPTLAQSWTQLAPTGGPPPARILASAVHNPANNRMIVFGGVHGAGFFNPPEPESNDVWVLENSDGLGGTPHWTQLFPTGGPPTPRLGHNAVYDPATNRMTIFGGNPNFGYCCCTLNDVWVLENADGLGGTPHWTQLFPAGGPPQRRWIAGTVYDAANNLMIMFGGGGACGSSYNDVWFLTNANGLGGAPVWTQASPIGTPPPPGYATIDYDAANNRMIVSVSGSVSDIWILEHANGLGGTPNWIQLSPTGGPLTSQHGNGAYDHVANRLIRIGGTDVVTNYNTNEVWVLEHANGLGGTPAWTQLTPTPAGPDRSSHIVIFNDASNRMTLFAGNSNNCLCPYNDVWVLETAFAPPECRADITGDGTVNVTDLLELLASWGACP